MMCEGTGCMNPAINDVSIRVLEPLAFVYRKYCDECTWKAYHRTMSEVVTVQRLPSVKATQEDGS